MNDERAIVRELPFAIDCEAAFATLFGTSRAAFWLDSGGSDVERARWSYLGDASGPGAGTAVADAPDAAAHARILAGLSRAPRRRDSAIPSPFTGGRVGWFGYEFRDRGRTPRRRARTPDVALIDTRRFLAVDHVAGRTFVIALAQHATDVSEQRGWCDAASTRIATLPTLDAPASATLSRVRFRLARDRARYERDVERALGWIREGESYQICLTNEFTCDLALDPFSLYRTLRRINPAPYAAYLTIAGNAVLSASPERFLTLDSAGNVESKPVKGTIARASDPIEDERAAATLRASAKDRAENVMIVDLLRNDLARVCEIGSVRATALFEIERYATVFQLVSTVRGKLRPGEDALTLLRAAFPGGSMTGAPKVRTMELIDALEGRARGAYSGAIGWIGDDGAADLSIAIRTIVAAGGILSIGCGGGVVAESTPRGEFDEMLLKATPALRAITALATGDDDATRIDLSGADDF